jgi:GDP-mannose 6-dehydrogenase
MQLSIFGLDYVGAVAAGWLAVQGHEVIAFDGDAARLGRLRSGLAPVAEPGLDRLMAEAVGTGRLTGAADVAEAVACSALTSIFVAAPGPALWAEIGAALAAKPKFHAIVLRGALEPGTVRTMAIPALECASGKRAGTGFGIGLYPAFLRRGTAIEDYLNPPGITLGVTDPETLARLREMDIALEAPETVIGLDEAEAMMHPDRRWAAPARRDESWLSAAGTARLCGSGGL